MSMQQVQDVLLFLILVVNSARFRKFTQSHTLTLAVHSYVLLITVVTDIVGRLEENFYQSFYHLYHSEAAQASSLKIFEQSGCQKEGRREGHKTNEGGEERE